MCYTVLAADQLNVETFGIMQVGVWEHDVPSVWEHRPRFTEAERLRVSGDYGSHDATCDAFAATKQCHGTAVAV